VGPQYEVAIGRVWAFEDSDLSGFVPAKTGYVLDVVWTDEDGGGWHRETFYGVTIAGRNRASRGEDREFADNQTFDAQYSVPGSGTGTPPEISSRLRYLVRYVSPTENIVLYTVTGDWYFTETTPGQAASRVTLTYTPDQSGKFEIWFAGQDWPALRVRSDSVTEFMQSVQGSVGKFAGEPRVDFYYGSSRLGSVTIQGVLYGPAGCVEKSVLPDGAGLQFFGGSVLSLAFTPGGIYARSFLAFNPGLAPGLTLWCGVENIGSREMVAATAEFVPGDVGNRVAAELDTWPDASGNNAPLLAAAGVSYGMDADGLPFVFLDNTEAQYLTTAAAVMIPDQWCVFCVVRPGYQGSGLMGLFMTGQDGTDYTNQIAFSTGVYDYRGRPVAPVASVSVYRSGTSFRTALFDYRGRTLGAPPDDAVFEVADGLLAAEARGGTATGTSSVAETLLADAPWLLAEAELAGGSLAVRRNGVTEATSAVSGTVPTDARAIYIGAAFGTGGITNGTLGGYYRAALVYRGALSLEWKGKVRNFLNLQYDIF
jgi:hypothetical protein